MNNIVRLKILLSPEQYKAMEDVLLKAELTIESFKLMRKDYAGIKSNVKRIEKKLLIMMEQEGYENYLCRFIENEIARIENKYKDIDHAIKHYHLAMKCFNDTIAAPSFRTFNPNETYNTGFYNLKSDLASANGRIDEAVNAMRITRRYFKQIAYFFKAHATHKAILSARQRASARAAITLERTPGQVEDTNS